MSYQVAMLTDNLFAFAVWDDELNTLINCYILKHSSHTVLIDSGKAVHAPLLVKALTQFDILPANVVAVIATHGHKDHVGGALTFVNATRFVPARDMSHIAPNNQDKYTALPEDLSQYGLIAFELNHHTKGHTIFYHPESKALFCGDYLTFYGVRPLETGLITADDLLVDKCIDTVHRWLNSPAVQARYNTLAFRQGLSTLSQLDVELLCTGHGPVLRDQCNYLLQSLAKL